MEYDAVLGVPVIHHYIHPVGVLFIILLYCHEDLSYLALLKCYIRQRHSSIFTS